MFRKVTVLLMVFVIVAASSYGCQRSFPPSPQRSQQVPSPNLPQEDKLAKSDQESVEENINGYNLADDLSITRTTEVSNKNKIPSLSQQQQAQMMKKVSSDKINKVLQNYNTTLPKGINNKVQYLENKISFDYFLITAEKGAEIRKNPTPDAAVVAKVENLDKVSLLQQVEGNAVNDSTVWYRVACKNNSKTVEGYLHSNSGSPRVFRFDKMQTAVNQLKQLVAQGELHFIRNYKNQYGAPPTKGNAAVDEFGYRVYHSAPAYEQGNTGSNFRYVPDGMLVRIIDETDQFYHVSIPTFNGNFYVPKQYIDRNAKLSKLNNVVVVDRTEQNLATFKLRGNSLDLISYTLSTTGNPGEFSFETPLGNYKTIEKKDKFEYLEKGSPEIVGYAPFAIRFSGGAYNHGVPVAYEKKDGKNVDPGTIEYLQTIGTFPRSNMCVRNFTSHAKFLWNWMDLQNGAVIVIE